jgi:hypothetical protein
MEWGIAYFLKADIQEAKLSYATTHPMQPKAHPLHTSGQSKENNGCSEPSREWVNQTPLKGVPGCED